MQKTFFSAIRFVLVTSSICIMALFADVANANKSVLERVEKSFNSQSLNNRQSVQSALKNAGVYDGRIDGEWGPSTSKAVSAAVDYVQTKNAQNIVFDMNMMSNYSFDRLFKLIATQGIFDTSRSDIECLLSGTAESCGVSIGTANPQQSFAVAQISSSQTTAPAPVPGECASGSSIPVGVANSPSMVLLSEALKAKQSFDRKNDGTIKSHFEDATVLYNRVSQILENHAASEVGVGLLSGACYGGISIDTARNTYVDAYSKYKSSGCESTPTPECLIAKSLTVANTYCGGGMRAVNYEASESMTSAALANVAIKINDLTAKNPTIDDIAEQIFDGCIEVASATSDKIYIPALLTEYMNHKLSIGEERSARAKLKLLDGSDKFKAVVNLIVKDKTVNKKIFDQLFNFIQEDEAINTERFEMSLTLLERAYRDSYPPPESLFNYASSLKYDINDFTTGEGHTCADFALNYEKLFINALSYASADGLDRREAMNFYKLTKSPIFARCPSGFDDSGAESTIRQIQLQTLTSLLQTQPLERALAFYYDIKEAEPNLNFSNKPVLDYQYEVAAKLAKEFDVYTRGSEDIQFVGLKCGWYDQFFDGDALCQSNWQLGARGDNLKLAYLVKNDACEGVKFMFAASTNKKQNHPAWFTPEQIAQVQSKTAPVSPALLQTALEQIDWAKPLECGDSEIERLLKE